MQINKKKKEAARGGAIKGLVGALAQAEKMIINYNFALLLFIFFII